MRKEKVKDSDKSCNKKTSVWFMFVDGSEAVYVLDSPVSLRQIRDSHFFVAYDQKEETQILINIDNVIRMGLPKDAEIW